MWASAPLSPLARLDVAGALSQTSPLFQVSKVGASYATSTSLIVDSSGNVGIGTTTPWRKLSATGTVGFDGLTAGAGAGSLCLTANKEVVYSDNAGCTGSSLRFKHDIVSLDLASGIKEAMKLRPVSFVYNDDIGVKGPQVGFIAEDVAQVDQRLITYDASGTPNNVKYQNMVAIAIKAIQDIANLTDAFKQNLIAWLADASNGITQFFAGEGHFADKLCVGDTCVTPAQFQAMVAAANQSSTGASGTGSSTPPPTQSNSTSSDPTTATSSPDTTPPTITISDNPTTSTRTLFIDPVDVPSIAPLGDATSTDATTVLQ